jgi:hypothetical protein
MELVDAKFGLKKAPIFSIERIPVARLDRDQSERII